MNLINAFNALNYITGMPKVRQALEASDPHALALADKAMARIVETDPVRVKALIVAERLDNIATNFGMRPGLYVQTEFCNGRAFISCRMRDREDAACFAAFVRTFIVADRVTVEEQVDRCSVNIVIDEDNV